MNRASAFIAPDFALQSGKVDIVGNIEEKERRNRRALDGGHCSPRSRWSRTLSALGHERHAGALAGRAPMRLVLQVLLNPERRLVG